ncbi:MAG: alpha/beta hydrolase [Acidimicrobiia bacterium]|nr:alpha/beta hydrolase [Acidimicrobiia bacterium]MDH4364389.1 alpha/beta hydrolase [Acidimicrobiia bacterium]MDH5288590.1 alpha/beta hydrolase [Acidimicrobiia bacterium]
MATAGSDCGPSSGGLRQVTASDGVPLAYEVGGPAEPDPGDGPPVVFLHGTVANRFAFRKVRPWFEERRRVVLTVLRGHGDGESRALPADYGLATTEVDDLLTVLDAEGLTQVDLFAHSTGGSIAVALAARHPERVRRMALVEPTLLPLLPLVDRVIADRVTADIAALLVAADTGDHPQALRHLLDFIGGTAWHAADANHARVFEQLSPLAELTGPHAAALASLDVTEADVRGLAAPTLLFYGKESAYFELTLAAMLARLRPDLEQIHVEGAGHNSHLERPDVVGPPAAAFLAGA